MSVDIYRIETLIIEIRSFERHRNNKQDDDIGLSTNEFRLVAK